MASIYNIPRVKFAIAAVRAAARRIARYDRHRADLRVDTKGPKDLVTNADLAAEAAALEVIRENFPSDGVLAEESGVEGDQDSCWVIDPIDGTTNFVHGLPEFSVSLAWCKDGRPEIGVIYDVRRDEMYVAARQRGAFCEQRRMKISTTRRMDDALIGSTGRSGVSGWRWEMLAAVARRSSGFRRIGSSALDLALTARGCLDAVYGSGLQYWDYAAGGLILQEAGGVVCDLDGAFEPEFGSRLGLLFFGNPRIVGNLRRLAQSIRAEHGGG